MLHITEQVVYFPSANLSKPKYGLEYLIGVFARLIRLDGTNIK
jgi:hypothetical protein